MSRRFIVRPEAEEDLAEAKKWYDDRRKGLGTEFVEAIGNEFAAIQRMPFVPRVVFKDLRRMLARRFPYAVYYRVTDEQITIVAVYHTRRDPRGWQSRSTED